MKVEDPDLAGSYTYSDYLTWTWSEMTELIHGKIFKMSPAPSSKHQIVAGNLFGLIWNYLRGQKCQVFIAPFDVRLPSAPKRNLDEEITTVVQPDICVVCDPSKIDARGCIGAPDWIVEILSPHTSAKDLTQKFDVYEEAGVKEYWVIHPQEQTVLVYILNAKGKYQGPLKPFVNTDHLTPVTLPGLTIPLEDIFPKENIPDF
jgi:Uma2 family endonuclease